MRVTGENAAHRRIAQFFRRVESARELRASENPGYRTDADSVEVVLAGCRESDWTAEVVTS